MGHWCECRILSDECLLVVLPLVTFDKSTDVALVIRIGAVAVEALPIRPSLALVLLQEHRCAQRIAYCSESPAALTWSCTADVVAILVDSERLRSHKAAILSGQRTGRTD
jgi:hypothetical protein